MTIRNRQTTTMLVALSAAKASGDGPIRQRFLPAGTHAGKASSGAFRTTVDAASAAKVIDAFRADTDPRKGLCDYDHESLNRSRVDGITLYGSTRASGHIRDFEFTPEEGLVALVDWTPPARRAIADGEYGFISPVFSTHKKTGELLSLDGLTLTNEPYYPELSVAARRGDGGDGCDLVALADEPGGKDTSMEDLKKVAAALGMPETATLEEVLAAIADMSTRLASEKTVVSARDGELVALRGDKVEVDAELVSLRAGKATLETELTALRAAELDRTIDAAVSALVAEKKVVGEDRVTALRTLYRDKGKEAFDLATKGLTAITALRSPGKAEGVTGSGTASDLRVLVVARAAELRKGDPRLSTPDAEMQALRALQGEKPELFKTEAAD